jgi:hypothetical protein
MSARRMTLVLGTAAGAFLAAGLIPLAASPVAHADVDGDGITIANPPGDDTDFISTIDPLLKLFGITDLAVDDPDEHFEAMVLQIPSLGITDVLTSGIDPSDHLATLIPGLPLDVTLPADVTAGTVDVTVNTLLDPSLGIDSSFTIPFTDPLADLWEFLVANDFFGL